jgi:aspartate aminotransferase-like enzyme
MTMPADMLMIPGPTPLPERVRVAMGQPAIAHRGEAFKGVMKRVLPNLQWAFQTQNPVLLYTASGTGAMEAALVNTLNPGDKVLGLSCGVFSHRWVEVAQTLGLDVAEMTVEPGQPNTAEALKIRLAAETGEPFKAVMLIHSETSTGVLNPVQDLVKVIRDYGALSIVDTVTSLCSMPCPVDEWGIDIAVSGSQKGFMVPPGLAFLSVSPAALAAHKQVKNPGYYFNFSKYLKAQTDLTTPYTPATHLIAALDEALLMMQEEGLPAIHARHVQNRNAVRAAVTAMGLPLLVPHAEQASGAATAVYPPQGLTVAAIRAGLKQHGIIVADGQGAALKGKIFRLGHLGYCYPRDVMTAISVLDTVLINLGYTPKTSGLAAAQAVYLPNSVAMFMG